MISASDKENYHRNGWVVPNWRLPADQLGKLQSLVEKALEARQDKRDYLPDLQQHAPAILNFAGSDAVLDMVEAFTGPDIAVWGTGVFGKPAHNGVATPWHQDGQYWPMRPLATTTVWLALDDATTENGCMRVISGSHKPRQLFDHRTVDGTRLTLNQELDWRALGFEKAEAIEVSSGQIILFDLYLIHGSHRNNSPEQRRAITVRYMPTTSHFDKELAARQHRDMAVPDLSKRSLFRMRGIDRCGKNSLLELPN